MPRFFVPIENIKDNKIFIDTDDVWHITKVLRMNEGDEIVACDGKGYDYRATISKITKNEIICDINERLQSKTEPPVRVTLYQGIPKGTKMEYIIQKTTELGISDIVPVAMKRCVSKMDNDKSGKKKLERWNKICAEAAKQSQRGIVPVVHEPISFDEAIAGLKTNELYFAPYECEEQQGLRTVLTSKTDVKTVGFMIGPEGGYDLLEVERLKENGIQTVTLGKRILRTETAGEAVLAMLMYEIGDINM